MGAPFLEVFKLYIASIVWQLGQMVYISHHASTDSKGTTASTQEGLDSILSAGIKG